MHEKKSRHHDAIPPDPVTDATHELTYSTSPNAATEIPVDSTPREPDLHEQLRIAELKAAEHHDAWLRAKAEADNTRRRAQDDIARAAKYAIEKFAEALLPVKDTLELALADPNPESLRTGVELTLKNLNAAFDKGGIKEENPAGKKFDPNKHQSIALVEADQDANTVVTVLQKGYVITDRTLRPAMVTVAKAK